MSDDLVKQSIEELRELMRCRCHPAYTDRGLHNSDCMYYMDAAVNIVADRIEELEAKLEMAEESLTVIDALDPEGFVNGCSPSALIGLVSRMGAIARTTLAELTGGNDD